MKTFLKIIVGILLLIAGAFWFFVHRPGMAAIKKNKPHLLKQADQFIGCFVTQKADICVPKYMTPETTDIEGIQTFFTNLNKKLGKRTKVKALDETFNFRTQKKAGSQLETGISFSTLATYEKQDKVEEEWLFVKKDRGPFLIYRVNINSSKLFE